MYTQIYIYIDCLAILTDCILTSSTAAGPASACRTAWTPARMPITIAPTAAPTSAPTRIDLKQSYIANIYTDAAKDADTDTFIFI